MSVNDATAGQADLVTDEQPVRSLRRVGRPWEATRRGARLFLEDVEELEELVEQAAGPDDPDWEARLPVRVETDGWEAAGVRMLLPHIGAGQLRRMRLQAHSPDGGLSVRLDPHRAVVTVNDRDDPTMRGLGEHAVELLDRAAGLRGRLAGAVVSGWFYIAWLALLMSLLGLGQLADLEDLGLVGAWAYLVAVLVSAALVVAWAAAFLAGVYVSLRGTRVTLASRAESPSFWARNRDALAVAVVGGLMVSLMSGVVGWLIGVGW